MRSDTVSILPHFKMQKSINCYEEINNYLLYGCISGTTQYADWIMNEYNKFILIT